MSYLLDKSHTNLESAQLLQQTNKYAAVPHCAYYSCLQRIKQELFKQYQYYCDDNSSELKAKSSHQVIWKTFNEQLEASQDWDASAIRDIQSCLDFLKSRRVRADYFHEEPSTKIDSLDSLRFAQKFHLIFNRMTNHE